MPWASNNGHLAKRKNPVIYGFWKNQSEQSDDKLCQKEEARKRKKERATHSHPPVGPPQSKARKCFSNGSVGDSICSGSLLREPQKLRVPASSRKDSWQSYFLYLFWSQGSGLERFSPVCGFLVVRQYILAETLHFLQASPSTNGSQLHGSLSPALN